MQKESKRILIGLMGTIGSGKGAASDYLVKKHGFFRVIMGDLVREKTKGDGLELTRENQHAIQKKYRDKYGQDYFIKETIKILKESGKSRLLIDGIRKPIEAMEGKEEGAYLILIDAPIKTRFERLKKRGSLRDAQLFPEFQKQEENEWKIFNFEESFRYADYQIKNDRTLEEFHSEIDKVMKRLIN